MQLTVTHTINRYTYNVARLTQTTLLHALHLHMQLTVTDTPNRYTYT